MDRSFWQRFPAATRIRCIEMKDRLQQEIMNATSGMQVDELTTFFHEASQRFWIGIEHVYPESAPKHWSVCERDDSAHPPRKSS
jgi:hypothetical protein